ncbi:MAG: hypothetical protein KTR22_01505 [Flavobacteriaceae bacterium]|nr:hypothetical protein [Flavobacteriaceae bacterium]
MKKHLLTLALLVSFTTVLAQSENKEIVTVNFVEVIDNQLDETLYYYENNWLQLRKQALKDNAIADYELLLSMPEKDQPRYITLITSYADKAQYDNREAYFGKLIEERGERKLLNEKQPKEFRKVTLGADMKRKFWN